MQAEDKRRATGRAKANRSKDYYLSNGLVDEAVTLYHQKFTQVEIAEKFTEDGRRNSTGLVGWTQPLISRLLEIARQTGKLNT